MAETEFVVTQAISNAPNPNRLEEPTHRPAAFLVWETNIDFTRKEVVVDNTAGFASILPGTVIVDGANAFVGILFGRPVLAGTSERKTVVFRGPAIVRNEKLIFPVVTNAVDGPDAGTDTVAENAAATNALEAALRAAMAAAGIDIR